MKEARARQDASNIVVKLRAPSTASRRARPSATGRQDNLTLCFQPSALMVAKAGAFSSPLIGRLDDVAQDGMDLIHNIRQIYDNYGYKTKLLAAPSGTQAHGRLRLAGPTSHRPFGVIKSMLTTRSRRGLKKFSRTTRKPSAAEPAHPPRPSLGI